MWNINQIKLFQITFIVHQAWLSESSNKQNYTTERLVPWTWQASFFYRQTAHVSGPGRREYLALKMSKLCVFKYKKRKDYLQDSKPQYQSQSHWTPQA